MSDALTWGALLARAWLLARVTARPWVVLARRRWGTHVRARLRPRQRPLRITGGEVLSMPRWGGQGRSWVAAVQLAPSEQEQRAMLRQALIDGLAERRYSAEPAYLGLMSRTLTTHDGLAMHPVRKAPRKA